ncbi:MAG: peptidoglycan-binding domain-containing protein [candidate division Zixibacteria bacterium]|nr:peptidoglycan-binding domain-containing protein [candidate division Zixibacteria bacterium]
MTVYMLGSRGTEVRKIQEKLKKLDYYHGPLDGEFGGGTDAAVRSFQRLKGLKIDGRVGPITWKELFHTKIADPVIIKENIERKCLTLTGCFETSVGIPECFAGLSSDFDGQGLSFGALQWNFGKDSLQPLLREMINSRPDIMESIFHGNYSVLLAALESDKAELMAFARSIQNPVTFSIYEPWRGMFKSLGRREEFQKIQLKYSGEIFQAALHLCREYELWSERALALMFDISVQNGSISQLVKARIHAGFEELPSQMSSDAREIEKMRIVANRRADSAQPEWAEDVRARKLCCANGAGYVHGVNYDLEAQFGIKLSRYDQ